MNVRAAVLFFSAALTAVTPAAAQTPVTSPPRVELGASLVRYGGEIGPFGPGGAQIAVTIRRRHAIQLVVDLDSWRHDHSSEFSAIYVLQYRYTFGAPAGNLRPFVKIGGAGAFWRYHRSAYTYTTGQSDTHTIPAFTDVDLYPPTVIAAGAGITAMANRHIGLTAQADFGVSIFGGFATRLSAGIVIPLTR